MKKVLMLIACSLLIAQSLLIVGLSINMSQGGHVFYRIGERGIYPADYDPLVQCQYQVEPLPIPVSIWEPGQPTCRVNPVLLIPSLILGVGGGAWLYLLMRDSRKKKK